MPIMLTVLNNAARAAMYEHLSTQVGVQVVHAEGALHALTQLERTLVDAIVCDAVMPEMTGAEFCSVVAGDQSTSRLPVYLIPGAPEAGDHRFVTLPAGPEVLARAFRHLGVDMARYPVPMNTRLRPELDGQLGSPGLPEFLNWVGELEFSGHWMITVRPTGGSQRTGHLAMSHGKVVYAEFGGRSGKAAILGLLRFIEQHPAAEFSFFRTPAVPVHDAAAFTQSTARLLIELAVDLDESSARLA
ncbi:response regulator [Deinococcus sp. KSM4-11]|nr:response regulator [Deinococcus sp. KSM4-11]